MTAREHRAKAAMTYAGAWEDETRARSVDRSVGARAASRRGARRAREARERRGTRSTRERTATACARALGESSMWVNAAHHAATIAAPMVPE